MNPNLPKEWERITRRYLTAQRAAGLSKGTVGYSCPRPLAEQTHTELGKYGAILVKLAAWMAENTILDNPYEVNRQDLQEWIADVYDAGSRAAVRTAIFTARGFYGWMVEEGLVSDNPALGLKPPTVKKVPQRTLNTEELGKILKVLRESKGIKGARNLAIIALMLDTGLRVSEVCNVRVPDVYFRDEGPNHLVTTIKGGGKGIAYFSDVTTAYLNRWLQIRPFVAADDTEEVFVSLGGNTPGHSMNRGGAIRGMCRDLATLAGIAKFSPHALRRSFAVQLTQNGAPSRTVMELGRWASIQMVERYTQGYSAGGQFEKYSVVKHLLELGQGGAL